MANSQASIQIPDLVPTTTPHTIPSSIIPHSPAVSSSFYLLLPPAQIVEAENESRTSGHTLPPQTLAPQQQLVPDAVYFLDLHPGTRTELVLPLHQASQTLSAKKSGALVGRFDAVVLDAAEEMAHAAIQECSVFIVPQVLTTKPCCPRGAVIITSLDRYN